MSSSTSKAAPQAEDPDITAEWIMSGQADSEVHQREPHNSVNSPGLDRSQDYQLEGTSIPQISGTKPTSDSVNNTGTFYDSNLSHINQGAHGTVTQGNNFSISRNRDVYNVTGGMVQNVNEDGLSGLNFLKEFVAYDALHDSSAQDPKRRCNPGTRQSVLKTMRNWIDNPNADEKVFWLHGPAGVGKSAIAQTISHSYERDKVAATFFFFRSDPNRNDGNRLFPTLAWQLAFSIPRAKNSIALALKGNPDLPRKTIEIQFERLIVRPLREISQIPRAETSAPVIIVDGVDECSDNELQQRFLETVCKAAMGGHMPVRFLISSRPEAHIRECFDQSQCPVLKFDLADANDAFRDIEKYLISEFTRIASKQGINPETWPRQNEIEELVNKSSGQFVYVATIVKFVGDDYEDPISQLDIILGLEPSDGKSPFAELDALYMEILQRQRNQGFVKEFLAIFIGRSTSEGFPGSDDALLFNTDKKGLHRKLRGMHSLLKIELGSNIGVHHQSFLDFLLDPLRSGQYHISEHSGRRRFLELIVAATVRHASKVIKEPDHHGSDLFAPRFASAIRWHPRNIDLPLQDWEEVLRPILIIRDEMLKLTKISNSNTPWKRGFCDGCSTFYIIDDLLLHLFLFRGTKSPPLQYQDYSRNLGDTVTELVDHERCGADGKQRNCVTTRTSEGGQHVERSNPDSSVSDPAETMTVGVKWPTVTTFAEERDKRSYEVKEWSSEGLDSCLLSILQNGESDLRSMAEPVQRLLSFDYAETVSKIRSISDAQKLLDLLFYTIHNRRFLIQWYPGAKQRALQLALEIYTRVPLISQSLFMSGLDIQIGEPEGYYYNGTLASGKHKTEAIFHPYSYGIFPICQIALVWGALSHKNVLPLLGICETTISEQGMRFVFVTPYMKHGTLRQWREKVNPSGVEVRDRMLEVARAVQYIHSLDLVLGWLDGNFVFIDSNFHAKIVGDCISPQHLSQTPSNYMSLPFPPESRTREYNIFRFGCLYYETYFGKGIGERYDGREVRTEVVERPAEPEIRDDVWSLIQRCSAEDLKSRPTMDEVVKEMESWSFF